MAALSAVVQGDRHVLLNGGTSSDPDGQSLEYHWLDGGIEIGTGQILDHRTATTGAHSFSLRVVDPGGLSVTSAAEVVNVL